MIRTLVAGGVAFAIGIAAWLGTDGTRAEHVAALPIAMAGTWTGDADIFVDWTVQRTLPVRITIAPDGRVSGTVGDAALPKGRLERNRTALGRALHIKTDWIVRGGLDGDIIKAEGIRRASVSMPLNWIEDHFEGGVNTSGSHFGGKDGMWLAAGRLQLGRAVR